MQKPRLRQPGEVSAKLPRRNLGAATQQSLPAPDSPQSVRTDSDPRPALFCTTRWTQIEAAKGETSPESLRARGELYAAYRNPIIRLICRKGRTHEEAEDLAQKFLQNPEKYARKADRELGRFRNYLGRALANFLHDEHEIATAQKRGGDCAKVSLDALLSDHTRAAELQWHFSPDKEFDRDVARTIVRRVVAGAAAEYQSSGKAELFEALIPRLLGDDSAPYDEIARKLGLKSADAVKKRAQALHERLRHLFRDECMLPNATAGEVDDEIRALIAAV